MRASVSINERRKQMPSSGRAAGSYCSCRCHAAKTKGKSKTNQRKHQTIAGWGTQEIKKVDDLFNALFLGKVVAKDGSVDDMDKHNATITVDGKPFVPLAKRRLPNDGEFLQYALEFVNNHETWSVDDKMQQLNRLQNLFDQCGQGWAYDYIQDAKKWLEENRTALDKAAVGKKS